MNKKIGIIAALGLLASVIVANWATSNFGFVSVGFGLTATAGTFAAGFALALRDATQDALGKSAVIAVIVLGAVVSYVVADPMIALASGAAFLISELCDFGVYTPLRKKSSLGDRRWAIAVVASNIVGAIVDTVVFLVIAFGAASVAPAILGQLVGKTWATAGYLVIGKGVSRAVPRKSVDA